MPDFITAESMIFVLGLVAGAIGYIAVTFLFQPMLRFRQLRFSVISDLVFFRNAINAKDLDNVMKQRLNDRVAANRRHAADLAAICYELPKVYHWYLWLRGFNLVKANSELLGFSNTFDWDQAEGRIKRIQKHLRVVPPVVS